MMYGMMMARVVVRMIVTNWMREEIGGTAYLLPTQVSLILEESIPVVLRKVEGLTCC